MAKLVLSDLANLSNPTTAVSTINSNNSATETALENTLSRDGTSPNSMSADLDMDSNRILNLPVPSSDTEPLRLGDLDSVLNADLVVESPTTDNAIVRWNGTTGQSIQNSPVTVDDTTGTMKWGTTSSYPAIKVNGADLEFRLADDSAGANITAAKLNKVTVTAPSTAATLTLADNSSLTTSGANALTLTTTGTTNATIPSGTNTLSVPGSAETITGAKTFSTAPVLNALPTGTAVATANTVSTLVARDSSGNFSAGTITGTLSGNATNITASSNTSLTSLANLATVGTVTSGTWGSTITTDGTTTLKSGTAPDASTAALLMYNTSIGIYAGSGAPSLSATKGSLYIRTDGSGGSSRLYINTNGSTSWTNITAAG